MGPNKTNVDIAKAWEAWVNNDQGGINGHPVRIIQGDTRDDPAAATTVANKMINEDKVIAEVGGGDGGDRQRLGSDLQRRESAGDRGRDRRRRADQEQPVPLLAGRPGDTGAQGNGRRGSAAGAKSFATVLCAEAPSCLKAADLATTRPRTRSIRP
jgi:branched-chain amino acid transport system substrate-binding protein